MMTETEDNEVIGGKPSQNQLEWIKYGQNLIRGSSESLENAAKTLVTLATSLITIYSVALSYFGNATKIFLNPFLFLLVIPFALFFCSIYFFIDVYSPTKHKIESDSPDDIKKAVKTINEDKYKSFRRGKGFFLIAFVLITVSLFYVSSCQLPENKVQFVVKSENVKIFNDMNIGLENNMTTTSLILINDDGYNYHIKRINSTDEIAFNKNLVNAIIY